MCCPPDSPASAGTLSIPITTHSYHKPTLARTCEKTTVGIQMAKNSPGVSLQTQESAQCSAPTSLSAAPKTSPPVTAMSTLERITKESSQRLDQNCPVLPGETTATVARGACWCLAWREATAETRIKTSMVPGVTPTTLPFPGTTAM